MKQLRDQQAQMDQTQADFRAFVFRRFRVSSWIVFLLDKRTLHEITRNKTKTARKRPLDINAELLP